MAKGKLPPRRQRKTARAYKATNRLSYSRDLGEKICHLLTTRDENGNVRSLKVVCQMDGIPCERAVLEWLIKHEEFARLYARAREDRAELIADDVIAIADTEEDPNKARVRIDARKWAAAKLNPRTYSEKLAHVGPDGGPVKQEVTLGVADEIARRIAGIAARGAAEESA